MDRNEEHAKRPNPEADDEHVEDLEPSPEDANAVRGGMFKEATGFDSESETSELKGR